MSDNGYTVRGTMCLLQRGDITIGSIKESHNSDRKERAMSENNGLFDAEIAERRNKF